MRRVGLVVTAMATALGGCGGPPDPDAAASYPAYRYRLTVEVETPEGLRSGSSVIEVRDAITSKYALLGQSMRSSFHGEAPVVDLPSGRKLFALLRSEIDADWGKKAMDIVSVPPTQIRSPVVGARAQLELMHNQIMANNETRALPRKLPPAYQVPDASAYPILVTFSNLRDPNTLKVVDPDNLPALFGKGYKLRQITVGRTTQPRTESILKVLPWLSRLDEYKRDNADPLDIPFELDYFKLDVR